MQKALALRLLYEVAAAGSNVYATWWERRLILPIL